jgi:hypothetical protein
MQQTLVTIIPGNDPNQRLALYLRKSGQESGLTLVQESWAEGIGWFAQSSVDVDSEQLPTFRQSLKSGTGKVSSRPVVHPSHLRVVG